MHDENQKVVCTLTYNLVEKVTGWYDQTTNRTKHSIHLYVDTISTEKYNFPLEHVHDLSYKPFSNGAGLFYLHTNQGLFMFEVDADPTNFIDLYKSLRK
ncbi:hypothetical protein [Sporosarcina jiandibaonis]|uniref:hypothetical protein n=1 Tax=Sporosarcina jiandibaonis TaxID=2715535 RepID=UPI001557BD7B|nr:hypothetical protein [Sporosarcina jiandibaonis]